MGSVIVCYLVEGVSVARPWKADHLAREDERVHQLAELGRGEVEVLEELVVKDSVLGNLPKRPELQVVELTVGTVH